jgi:hypothetical protein
MSESIGKETIVREKGFIYCIKADGKVWAIPAKSNKTGKPHVAGKEQIKKEPGYLYFLGSDCKIGRSAMKNSPKKK